MEVIEATSADTYYLPPSSNQAIALRLSTSVSAIQVPNQMVPAATYPNPYNIHPSQIQINQINPTGTIVAQPQTNVKPLASSVDSTLQNRDTCTICINPKTNLQFVPCGHRFHVKCIVGWINKKKRCPNCNDHNIQALIACNRCGNFN